MSCLEIAIEHVRKPDEKPPLGWLRRAVGATLPPCLVRFDDRSGLYVPVDPNSEVVYWAARALRLPTLVCRVPRRARSSAAA
jgi:hypothetical protein